MSTELMLVLLLGLCAVFVATRPVFRKYGENNRVDDAKPKPILWCLLFPLAAIVLMLLSGTAVLLYQEHRQNMQEKIAADITNISSSLRVALDQAAAGLDMAAKPIAADPVMLKTLREGDADRLLAAWRPVFDTMRRENNVTHFYFFDTKRVCLLRIHKPETRGDIINRFTALKAERTGKTASGIELGPLGTFTLRVVQPVFEGDTLVGYVELGKEIEDLLKTLHTRFGHELVAVIRKEYLQRQSWESGMRMLGRDADWNRMPRSVVIYSSMVRLPDPFASLGEHFSEDHTHGETGWEIAFDGKNWVVSTVPLKDASGKEVGDLLIMRDSTADKVSFMFLLTLGGTVFFVLLALLLGFIYVLLRRTDAGIKAQQAALQASETMLNEVGCMAKVGGWALDLENGTLTWTREVYAIHEVAEGFQPTLEAGINFYAPESRPIIQQAVTRTIQTGEPFDLELELITAKNHRIWVHALGHALRVNGKTQKISGTFQDITEHKRAEKEKEIYEERNRKLQKAESLNLMSGSIAHHFNNQLSVVIGYLEMLIRELPSNDSRTVKLIHALHAAGKASEVSGHLLSCLGQIPGKRELLDLAELCRVNLPLIQAGMPKCVTLETDLPSPGPYIKANSKKLKQLLSNLVINAWEAIGDKPGTIRLSAKTVLPTDIPTLHRFPLEWHPKELPYACLEVTDSGCGIKEADMDKLFDPFFSTKFTGRGLGLSIVLGIAMAHGAAITVETWIDGGSIFRVFFPLSSQTAPIHE